MYNYTRTISSKVMPAQNSPTNIAGKKVCPFKKPIKLMECGFAAPDTIGDLLDQL